MGPSLDHIEPLSLGGKHVPENVQITHLACNMAKGNRGGGEQLLLIG
jgi:5-methylcytosine-specific restriction endonuclease McrA